MGDFLDFGDNKIWEVETFVGPHPIKWIQHNDRETQFATTYARICKFRIFLTPLPLKCFTFSLNLFYFKSIYICKGQNVCVCMYVSLFVCLPKNFDTRDGSSRDQYRFEAQSFGRQIAKKLTQNIICFNFR